MSSSYQLKSHPSKFLHEHLKSVALSAKRIVEETCGKISTNVAHSDLAQAAFVTGATHDIGKGTTLFQNYMLSHTSDIDPILKSHSMISSLYCSWVILHHPEISDKHRNFLALASSLAIQGHHGSLKRPTSYLKGLDYFDEKEIFSKQIEAFENIEEIERISKDLGLRSFVEFSNSWQDYFLDFGRILVKFCSSIVMKEFVDFVREPYFMINLLYSALLDADRMDAAGLVPPKRLEINLDVVTNFVKRLNIDSSSSSTKEINKFRNMLFNHVNKKSEKQEILDKKIFTLTAPTGLGKTLTSVNFALNVRRRIQQERGFTPRIIYVAPFISILDQNMEVLQNVFRTQGQQQQTNLLLMHHHLAPITYAKKDVIDEQKEENYSTSQSELLIQGWNAEVIVTTFIQFFNTIFGRYASQLRRLDNLVGSIVILDEVQSIPFEYWGTVRNALLFLSEKFSFTLILMTATQPLIFEKGEVEEIAPAKIQTLPQRVFIQLRNQQGIKLDKFCIEINSLIDKNMGEKTVLVELNTIATAKEVFRSIVTTDSNDNIFFLSSQIIPKHRKPRIDKLKQSLENSKRVVLVTTQVIEAGMDFDFDIAVRDIGPIDSIVQTAGRCNRNGIKKYSDSPFFIYRIVDDRGIEVAKYVYGRVSIEIANSLIHKNSNLVNLVESYYQEIQRRRSNQEGDKINVAISELNYEEVEKAFNLIDKQFKVPVFVEFDDNATEIWGDFVNISQSTQPNAPRTSRNEIIQLKHQMEQYMIGVSEKEIQAANLEEISGVYKINHGDIGILYDEIIGFTGTRT